MTTGAYVLRAPNLESEMLEPRIIGKDNGYLIIQGVDGSRIMVREWPDTRAEEFDAAVARLWRALGLEEEIRSVLKPADQIQAICDRLLQMGALENDLSLILLGGYQPDSNLKVSQIVGDLAPPSEDDDEASLQALKVDELKTIASALGIPLIGRERKADLIKQIRLRRQKEES